MEAWQEEILKQLQGVFEEVLNEDYLRFRISQTRYLGEKINRGWSSNSHSDRWTCDLSERKRIFAEYSSISVSRSGSNGRFVQGRRDKSCRNRQSDVR